MSCGIYQIRNSQNKKVYIGSSNNIERRLSDHFRNLKRGTHHSKKLQRSFDNTNNKSVFIGEILEVVADERELKVREQFYIDKFNAFNSGYNCSAFASDPRYTTSTNKRDNLKCELARFQHLYSSDYILISNLMLSRINEKHYSPSTLHKINEGIEWFIQTYDSSAFKYRVYHCGDKGKEISSQVLDANDRYICENPFTSTKVLEIPIDDINMWIRMGLIEHGENDSLIVHEVPEKPLGMISKGLIAIHNNNYTIITDYNPED